jgi:hypothetical protein
MIMFPRFRFRVTLLLSCFLVVSLILGYMAHRRQLTLNLRQQVARLGGHIEYSYQFDEHGFNPKIPAPLSWLSSWISDSLIHPWHIELWQTNTKDSDLLSLDGVTDIRLLSLGLNPIADKGTIAISKMVKLTGLGLEGTHLTDVGVANLSGLNCLEDLDLGGTLVTDECIDDLCKLSSLRHLNIDGTKISAEAARTLQMRMPRCQIEY